MRIGQPCLHDWTDERELRHACGYPDTRGGRPHVHTCPCGATDRHDYETARAAR